MDNSKLMNDLLKNANPKAVDEIRRMVSSGELDSVRNKLSDIDRANLLSAISKSGGNINNLKNDPAFSNLANDPAMRSILSKLSKM